MNAKTKKTLNILANVATWVVAGFAIIMVLLTMLSYIGTIGDGDTESKGIFGVKPYVVLSGSMDRVFPAGSVIFVKEIEDFDSLKVGDIITFKESTDSNKDTIVTHQIVRFVESWDGEKNESYRSGLVTKGTENEEEDKEIYSHKYEDVIIGEYVGHVAGVGYVIHFLQSKMGFFLLIAIPLVIIILLEMKNIVIVINEMRSDKKKAIAEKEQAISAELDEAKRVKAELEALKAQLAQAQGVQPTEQPTEEIPTEQPPTQTVEEQTE